MQSYHDYASFCPAKHDVYSVLSTEGGLNVNIGHILFIFVSILQYAIVLCSTEHGSATSSGNQPGQNDYQEQSVQIQFEEREETKICTIFLNDDTLYEGPEDFIVELSMPAYALLGDPSAALVTVMDDEDGMLDLECFISVY